MAGERNGVVYIKLGVRTGPETAVILLRSPLASLAAKAVRFPRKD